MARHRKKGGAKEIIHLKDYRETEARVEYEEDGAEGAEAGEEREKKRRFPKAAYRVAIILLVLVLALAVWVNRENLRPENVWNWVKLQLMGSSEGDGFPVTITGSQVLASNFAAQNGNAMVLSDTALTVLSDSGRELLSLRHSLDQPALRTAGSMTLLYNQGSLGYLVLSGMEEKISGTAERELLFGAIAQNGRFALGLQGADGASELQVFQPDGSLQYRYQFARDYITAIALNYDGAYGVVCTVRSEKGKLISKVTVFDFSKDTPLSSFETEDTLLLDAAWTEGGEIYAVGDSSLLLADSASYDFTEYSYEGRQLTAYCFGQSRAFVSVSAYEHAGPSTLLVFHGGGDPLRVECDQRMVSISVSGGTVAALANSQAIYWDSSTGEELGRADAGSDAKSIALASEKLSFVLGVSEVRTVEIE